MPREQSHHNTCVNHHLMEVNQQVRSIPFAFSQLELRLNLTEVCLILEAGYWIDRNLYDEVLQQVGE
ncbi:hypothetical protein [Scytonema sp. UIC 10036]|uniref:hypothetical protein n=1 Tax=Scytonema sp. UIC 10036 TaxID=2304196 RepID=UPI001A9B7C36|nr:hypothetical protein [Scytonema sp. UIC 10036]